MTDFPQLRLGNSVVVPYRILRRSKARAEAPARSCLRAMASSADSANGEIAARPRNRGPQFKFLVPLIYAPVLPLIRIGLRRNPVLRDRLFTAVLAGGFLHGFYLVTDLYDIESK